MPAWPAQGVVLTAAGHVALQHAMRLFQGFEQFSRELNDYSRGVRGHVRLWAWPTHSGRNAKAR